MDLHARPSAVAWARSRRGRAGSQHSLTWIGAFDSEALIGFVHACWDGGLHAFLLDTVVDPAYQRRGLGQTLVQALVEQVKDSSCEWLHVDYEAHLADFYSKACGFRTTPAGLLHLHA